MNRIVFGSVACALILSGALDASPVKAATESVVYSFCKVSKCHDGAEPYAALINVNGTLYGTTADGGKSRGKGTVFSLDPQTGAFKKLYSFCSQANCADGAFPESALIEFKGKLYGTTEAGGAYGCGTVFSVTLQTLVTEAVVYSFPASCDGNYNDPSLINVKGTFYGTTAYGGTDNVGTVFSINPRTGTETVLYSFQNNGKDGNHPESPLLNVGTLYGTTSGGGANGWGTVFSLDPTNGAETVVYSFCGQLNCIDGSEPTVAGLVSLNSYLYGTTVQGGTNGVGTVFSLDPTNGAETVLQSFALDSAGGDLSLGTLLNVGGTLYGTTVFGGELQCDSGEQEGCGTVFSINPSTGAETVVWPFGSTGADGQFPQAGLINVNGTFYGTTQSGGTLGYGTVFAITP
jgi:uncharacterized repeat protein (TIGR03803 family)